MRISHFWWETQVNILFDYTLLAIIDTEKGITRVGKTRNFLLFIVNGTRQKKNPHRLFPTGETSRFVHWELVRPYAVPIICNFVLVFITL